MDFEKDIIESTPKVASTSNNVAIIGANSLSLAAKIWFVTFFIGQLFFVFYIIALYGISAIQGDFQKWNAMMPHGYIKGDMIGNIIIGVHLVIATIIGIGGPLQIIPGIRNSYPRFHRWNGRIYIFAAIIISFSGLYLSWVRGSVGGLIGSISISINGILIILFAVLAIRYAMAQKYQKHRKWALRLLMVMSGVWFFRVGLMLWLFIHQKPVGFDPETFQGPFLTFLNFGQYLLPLALLEVYFWAQQKAGTVGKYVVATSLAIITIAMAIGIFATTMGMWFPLIK